jgi:hypothetical protein
MAAAPFTYSFLDVQAAIVGPGGSFALGVGAGVVKEGITIVPNEDIDIQTVGADGQGMHSLVANRSGKITIRLLKTSPVNQQLALLLAAQRLSASLHGLNTITLVNKSSGDVITAQQCAFARVPDLTYAAEGGFNEWVFNANTILIGLGAGV